MFNPASGSNTFQTMTSDRLESVFFSYRRVGDVTWQPGLTQQIEGAVNLDFASMYADEDNYGYITMEWFHGGAEGKYEIMVEALCEPLGGPAEIDMYRERILTGVIDLTKPEQYGEPLPLRDNVLVGEEVFIVFTEPLDCEKPFTFDISVTVLGTNYVFDKDDLHVICEGRKIGFQIDLTNGINADQLMGKQFTVEIGKIGDIKDAYGNIMVNNIDFQKTFANLNLAEASTSFSFTLDMVCSDITVANLVDDIKNEIGSILSMTDTSRIELIDLNCRDAMNRVVAEVTIIPPSAADMNVRNLKGGSRNGDAEHSTNLFYKLRDVADEVKQDMEGRRLGAVPNRARSFEVSAMRILPSATDLAKFKTHPDNEERERELYYIASMRSTDVNESSDFNFREMAKGQSSMVHEMEGMQQEMEALRKLDEAKMEDNKNMLEDMKETFILSCIVMVGCICVCVAFAAFLHLKR